MLKYHEIYPLENAANKIEEELEYQLKAKPRMYKTTRERYKKLACQLLESVEKISMLLEEDALVSDSLDEFDELSNKSDMTKAIKDTLKRTASTLESANSFSSVTSADNDVEPTADSVSNESIKLDYADIVHRYTVVLNDTDSISYKYAEVADCANLIRDWFNCRFVINSDNFIYNIRYLPDWISNIILLYGKYQSNNKTDELKSKFQKWMNDVENGNNNKWAVPYEVLQMSKKQEPDDFTINAVIISDILFDMQYYRLTTYEDKSLKVCLASDQVVKSVRENNPSLIPKIRTRLANKDRLIEECNLNYLEGYTDDVDV